MTSYVAECYSPVVRSEFLMLALQPQPLLGHTSCVNYMTACISVTLR